MGVVSGIVMSYQFGTNWSVYSEKAGPIVGPLMAYEVLTAFFLEAGFLGVMLFGSDRKSATGCIFLLPAWSRLAPSSRPPGSSVPTAGCRRPLGLPSTRAVSSCPRALGGASCSTRAFPIAWCIPSSAPTSPPRWPSAAWVPGTCWRTESTRMHAPCSRWRCGWPPLVAPLQILAGDTQGLNTLEHQPIKLLAMEGDYDPSPAGAPLILFGLPSDAEAAVRDRLEIPKLGSLILRHDLNAPLPGLKDFPRSRWPPVAVVFWSFRIMVALGFAIFALGVGSLVAQRARPPLRVRRLLHRAAVLMGPAGLRGGHRRLGHDRGRSAAVHRLWPAFDGAITSPRSPLQPWRLLCYLYWFICVFSVSVSLTCCG